MSSFENLRLLVLFENVFIWFLPDGLKPSITVQIEQQRWKLENWENVVKKTINAEAKTNFLPAFITRKIDQ